MTQDKEDALFLRALEAAGVDNWGGWEYAVELFHEMKETEEKREKE